MARRPISSQTKATEDNVVDPNPACDTLIHFSDPVVDVASVRIRVNAIPAAIGGVILKLEFILRAQIYCVCETLSCETTCTTPTPGPQPWEEEISVILSNYMNTDMFSELKKQWKEGKFDKPSSGEEVKPLLPGFGTDLREVSLTDLLDADFVSNDYVNNPDDANGWFAPVTDAVNKYAGQYIRPNGKDSFSLNEYLSWPDASMEAWNYTFGMTKPCTCQRVVTHTNQVSNRTNG